MSAVRTAAEPGVVYPARYAVCDEFLAPSEAHSVRARAFASAQSFQPAGVARDEGHSVIDPDFRRSLVCYSEPYIEELFAERLAAHAETIFERLCLEPRSVAELEVQVTRSGDGEFFAPHRDNGDIATSRYVTFVYYFHREPKPFQGGELRLYASRRETDGWRDADAYADVRPRQNRLIVFPSFLRHELRLVRAARSRFEDGRFTVNGWFHV